MSMPSARANGSAAPFEGPNGFSSHVAPNGVSSAAGLKFKRDSYLRRDWFHPDSFKHQAKANLNQLRWIAEHYLQPGQLVVDPMGGTGSAFILATDGHPVVCGDIATWLRPILAANARGIAQRWLFARSASGVAWDAAKLPLASGSTPAVVFSPPYWDMFSDWHISSNNLQHAAYGPFGSAYGDDRGKAVKTNIGNIHIYEDYLRAMRAVYCEAWRVLKPGGVLALIVKDRIHKRLRVPITRDTLALCRAAGFQFIARHECETILSQYRRVNARRHPETELLEHETILVMRKGRHAPARRVAIVAMPETLSGPPGQAFQKQIDHARAWAKDVWLLAAPSGLWPVGKRGRVGPACGFPVGDGLKAVKAASRRRWAFDVCDELVYQGYGAGAQFLLHVPERYATYLEQRLRTFGYEVDIPTRGLNAGQKMAWLTRQVTKAPFAPWSRDQKAVGDVGQYGALSTSVKVSLAGGYLER